MNVNESVLVCKDLHKKIGKKEILKGVSLEIKKGDILGFIGPNGAGKTTTIKLILGLQNITSGEVKINGYDIEKDFTKAIAKVGAIVENPDLYMYLSGFQNLKLIGNLYPDITDKRISEVVKLVKLENRIQDKVAKYSLGMRQRLGVAQAILHNPNLLILDEPTNGLDPEGIKEMRELLQDLAKQGMAVLISSHNLAELENFCNKVSIIKNGSIVETSDINEVKKASNTGIYKLELDSIEKAKSWMQKKQEKIEIINQREIKCYIPKEEIPAFIEELVHQHVKIYSVTEEKASLEEAFLKKTGGNIID